MWLLSTDHAELRSFFFQKAAPQKYAILSHCWGPLEESFQDVRVLEQLCAQRDGTAGTNNCQLLVAVSGGQALAKLLHGRAVSRCGERIVDIFHFNLDGGTPWHLGLQVLLGGLSNLGSVHSWWDTKIQARLGGGWHSIDRLINWRGGEAGD